MITRLARSWHRFRRGVSRTEWLIRLLGMTRKADDDERPGLIMVQIDGLSRQQLERALKCKRMPFLSRLLQRQGYRLHTLFSGLPSSTPAVQGELFYGCRMAVPAFSFFDEAHGRVLRMYEAHAAEAVEAGLKQQGEPLLEGGTAYMNVYTGGAEESHFCVPGLRLSRMLAGPGSAAFIGAMILNPLSLLRVVAVFGLEIVLALVDCARGIIAGRDLWKELRFVPARVGICIFARELITIGARMDVIRGFPIVHLNLLGYDEQAHRRGPSSKFAHWTLGGIDNAIERIWRKAQHAPGREYDLYVYSDHGNKDAVPFSAVTGTSIQAAARRVFADMTGEVHDPPDDTHGIQLQRLRVFKRAKTGAASGGKLAPGDLSVPIVTAMGPIGHVYWPRELEPQERERLARALVSDAQVPLVLYAEASKRVRAYTAVGDFVLPDHAGRILGHDHPHLDEATQDLMALCRHPKAGMFVLSGWRKHDKSVSFAVENGSHAGPGPEETTGFALLPADAPVPDGKRLRPIQLRQTALVMLGRRASNEPARKPLEQSRIVRLLTYNVHGCIGMDGRLSPRRIGRVIAQCEPDIVALQELDRHRPRTRRQDQARLIAGLLQMEHHFHSAWQLSGEYFGNAVLSRLPMRLVKAGPLPRGPGAERHEPRAAIWVEIDIGKTMLQVLNTHLGLRRSERLVQVQALLGRDWLGNRDIRSPTVLCGDLNALPTSLAYQKMRQLLRDAQMMVADWRPRATWPARWPIGRIDHVFVSPEVTVTEVRIFDGGLACVASDHRPLLASLEVRPPPARDE